MSGDTVSTTRAGEVMARARASLAGMIRRRDPAGIAAMRSIIAALENAQAVREPAATPSTREAAEAGPASEFVAGAGPIGQTEVPRRSLTDTETDDILTQEITMRTQQADVLDQSHRDLEAAMARYQATLITRLRDAGM